METIHLPDLDGFYLEDSYLLGFMAVGKDIRLNALFALNSDHPSFETPKDGEAHCYREGYILIESPTQIETKPGRTTILADPDGSLDLGSIELHKRPSGGYFLVTDWFEASFVTDNLSLKIP
ncbi:MAG: hypothetical protein AAGK17_13635 [Pseudomonadota bacterium]